MVPAPGCMLLAGSGWTHITDGSVAEDSIVLKPNIEKFSTFAEFAVV